MIWIVLAAGFGIANCIVLALLFRRLRRDLDRQLRDMRAEHNSEWILRALRDAPEERAFAVQAANGRGFGPPPMGPQPVRRKGHLGLFIGGAAAALAAFSMSARETWHSHRSQLVATGVAAAVTATTIALIVFTPWANDSGHEPPSSAPTAGPPPEDSQSPPGSGPSARGPEPSGSVNPTPSESARANPSTTPSLMPISDTSRTRGTQSPSEQPSPPGGESSPGSPEPGTSPPAESPPQEPPTEEPTSRATPGLCVDLAIASLLDIHTCLLGGGV